MVPTVLLVYVIPFGISYWLSSEEAIRFYDYLAFSVMDYASYVIVIQVIASLVEIVAVFLQYSLLLVPAIIAENPKFGGFHAMRESFRLSKGNRFYLFLMSLSFIGWMILGALALYIGVLWAMLYMVTATYAYYRRITILETPITVSDAPEIKEE